MFVKENFGDIIKTDLFQKYINTMNFKVHLCKAYDPESKGKIEAVVKFIKNNFAKYRIFTNIDDFNELCFDWLKRTGNAKEHSTIKKVPEEMFSLEKEHLQQVPQLLFAKEESNNNIVPYSLAKDNTVTYKSNRYQLPKETYSDKQKEVGVICEENRIIFFSLKTKESINTYEICKGKGKLISNILRNITPDPKVLELKSKILNRYSNENLIIQYIENIEILKKRYIKSQFKRIDSLSTEYNKETFLNAIKECTIKDNFDLDFLAKLLNNTKKNIEVESSLQNDSYKYNLLYKRILNTQVLLLDEIGYLPISKEEANLFFQLISKLDEKVAMVITSNKTFSEWTEFLGDPALATAVLDRLSFRCEIFNLTGNSYRLEKREHLFNE